MPKRPTDKTGFPRDPKDCFESRHLTPAQFKVYHVMRACAHSWRKRREGAKATGPLVFNASVAPWLCNAVPIGRTQAFQLLEDLEALGWIEKTAGVRRADGKQAPNEYRILEHDEFVSLYPDSCPPNIFSPDGGKARSRSELPKNFRKQDDLGRALEILDGGATFPLISDSELAALNKYFAESDNPDPVTESGYPGPAVNTRSGNPDADRIRKTEHAGSGNPDIPHPEIRTESVTTSTKESINPFPLAKAEGGLRLTQPAAIIEVNALSDECMRRNDGVPKSMGGKERQTLEKLAIQHSREEFRAACRAWLNLGDWRASNYPFGALIAGFETFKKKSANDAVKAKTTQAEIEAAYERARLLHIEQWDLNPDGSVPRDEEPSGEEFLKR
jgi:hypothetical protein